MTDKKICTTNEEIHNIKKQTKKSTKILVCPKLGKKKVGEQMQELGKKAALLWALQHPASFSLLSPITVFLFSIIISIIII